jgi:hypothetical protein
VFFILLSRFNPNDLAELPENSPRFIILSYELKHRDGRTSFPLILVNWAPTTSSTDLLTLHASAFLDFQTQVYRYRPLLATLR